MRAVMLVSEHAVYIKQCRVFGIQTGTQRMVENKLKTGTPGCTEQILEGLHEKVSRVWSIIGRNGVDEVPGNGVLQVTGVEIHHLIAALAGNGVDNRFGQIAMGVNNTHASTPPDVCQNDVTQ